VFTLYTVCTWDCFKCVILRRSWGVKRPNQTLHTSACVNNTRLSRIVYCILQYDTHDSWLLSATHCSQPVYPCWHICPPLTPSCRILMLRSLRRRPRYSRCTAVLLYEGATERCSWRTDHLHSLVVHIGVRIAVSALADRTKGSHPSVSDLHMIYNNTNSPIRNE